MTFQLQQITDFLDAFAPLDQAERWDNVGLLLGDHEVNVQRIMTCLTLTSDVAREAIERDAQLIVSHHPIFFRPVQKLTSAIPEGKLVLALLRSGIAVYSPHTAFDSARLGINQMLASWLGLQEIEPIRSPLSPSDNSPGAGRWGKLNHPVMLREFLELVRARLKLPGRTASHGGHEVLLQYVGELDRPVSTVGIGCGSAAEFLKDAARLGCDLFLTGEARFHDCLEARETGIALVLAGHYGTERPGVEHLADLLQTKFSMLTVWASQVEIDPLSWSVS